MKLQDVSIGILSQLIGVTEQFSRKEYTRKLDLLSSNSAGRHLRHILEFYDLAVRAGSTGKLNYDKRLATVLSLTGFETKPTTSGWGSHIHFNF